MAKSCRSGQRQDRRRSRRYQRLIDRDETTGSQIFSECQDVAFHLFTLNFEFRDDVIAQVVQRILLYIKQFPDEPTDFVKTEISSTGEVEQNEFTAYFSGNRIVRCADLVCKLHVFTCRFPVMLTRASITLVNWS